MGDNGKVSRAVSAVFSHLGTRSAEVTSKGWRLSPKIATYTQVIHMLQKITIDEYNQSLKMRVMNSQTLSVHWQCAHANCDVYSDFTCSLEGLGQNMDDMLEEISDHMDTHTLGRKGRNQRN